LPTRSAGAAATTTGALIRSAAWIEQRVQDVGEQREADIDRRQDQHDRLHHRKVVLGDAFPAEIADAVQREHGLDHDRAAEHEAELHRGDRHHRDRGIAQRVLEDDARTRKPFGARRADIVGRHGFDHARAGEPRECGYRGESKDDAGHHEVLPGSGAGDRQDAEVQAEHDHQDQREPEARDRLTDHRQHGDGAVDPGVLAHRRQDAERDRDDQREAQAYQASVSVIGMRFAIRFATLSLKK
jgi:hypothetical protein